MTREEEKTDQLEVLSKDDCSVGDYCMVEEILRQPYQGYPCQSESCDWSSPHANQGKDEAKSEKKQTEDQDFTQKDNQNQEPVGRNDWDKYEAEATEE